MSGIPNRSVRAKVQAMEHFVNTTSSIWGEWVEDRYCVFSYRHTWPIFVAERNDDGTFKWYENVDKYSITTSRHVTYAHPHVDTMPMTVGAMRSLVVGGAARLAVHGETSSFEMFAAQHNVPDDEVLAIVKRLEKMSEMPPIPTLNPMENHTNPTPMEKP